MRILLTLTFILFRFSLQSQIHYSNLFQLNDSIAFQKGIYLSKQEFLSNSPSVPYYYELIRKTQHISVFIPYGDFYLLEYYDVLGNKISKPLTEVWAFCNDQNVYFCYQGRPYGVFLLGNISILSYYDELDDAEKYTSFSEHIQPYFLQEKFLTDYVLMNFQDEIFVKGSHKNLMRMLHDMSPFVPELQMKEVFTLDETIPLIGAFNQEHPLNIASPKENRKFLSVDFFNR